jgi:hypothetical protein
MGVRTTKRKTIRMRMACLPPVKTRIRIINSDRQFCPRLVLGTPGPDLGLVNRLKSLQKKGEK